jgi:Zn-finger nucleic acid-binding protein
VDYNPKCVVCWSDVMAELNKLMKVYFRSALVTLIDERYNKERQCISNTSENKHQTLELDHT